MGVVTCELRLEFASSMTSRELLREPFGLLSTMSRELLRDEDSWEEFEPLRDAAEEDSDDSNDFFLSEMVALNGKLATGFCVAEIIIPTYETICLFFCV